MNPPMLGFGNIGPLEIVVILIIALIVFGPKRLPELGNSLGRGIREFRSTVAGEKRDDEDQDAIEASPAGPPAAQKTSEAGVAHDKSV
jgi:sec-independent protein translocase protein TatA